MTFFNSRLLRRTAVVLAAVAGFAISMHAPTALAQNKNTVTLNGNCDITINPDGSFNVTCTQGSTQVKTCTQTNTCTNAGTFSFTQSTASSPVNGQVALFIQRTGNTSGTDGSVNVPINFTGACFWGANQSTVTATFAPGQNLLGFYATAGATDGTCSINLGAPTMASGTTDYPPTVSGPAIALTVGTGGNGTGSAAGCPTGFVAPSDLQTSVFPAIGNPSLVSGHSNQITSLQLPTTQVPSVSGAFSLTEATAVYTPSPVTINISISKCKGFIDTSDYTNRCNLTSQNGSYTSMSWFSGPSIAAGVTDAATANAHGSCWAPASDGPYWVNMRWSYSSCASGVVSCGFSLNQSMGAY